MTTYTPSLRSDNWLAKFLIFALMLSLAGGMVYGITTVAPNQHAQISHGVAAWDAAYCFAHGKIFFSRINPKTGRKMMACKVIDGADKSEKYFIGIFAADGAVVTMYPKECLTAINQVVQYVLNSGFTQNP